MAGIRVLPEARDRLFEDHEIFALLTPTNDAAIEAFSSVVDAINTHESAYAHQSKFVLLNSRERKRLHEIRSANRSGHSFSRSEPSGESTFSSPHTDTTNLDPEIDPDFQEFWHGCYALSLIHKPLNIDKGWVVGYGSAFSNDPNAHNSPDVVVGLADQRRQLRLHGTTADFNFMKDTGLLAVRPIYPDSGVSCDNEVVTRQYQLTKPKHTVSFGVLDYAITYTVSRAAAEEYTRVRDEYMVSRMKYEKPIEYISATPTPDDIVIGQWTIQKPAGQGAQSAIRGAIHSKGRNLVAVKSMARRSKTDASRIQTEVTKYDDARKAILEKKPFGYEHILMFREAIYSSQSSVYRNFPDDVYILFEPLCRFDLNAVIHNTTDVEITEGNKLEMFAQLLFGISALHAAGFVHRDIKPGNIAVKSMRPVHVVIIDLGHLCDLRGNEDLQCCLRPSAGHFGTRGYIAPEMEGFRSPGYGQPVDIWSAGCVGLELIVGRHFQRDREFNPFRDPSTYWKGAEPSSERVDAEVKNYETVRSDLIESEAHTVEHLIGRMLYYSYFNRPLAEEAIQHGAFEEYRVAAERKAREAEEELGKKRRRNV